MPHEIESRNGRAAMAYNANNGTPWHNLGTPIDGTGTVDQMLQAADLDWTVTLEPVYAKDRMSGLYVAEEGKFFTTRSDDGRRFDVVGEQYQDLSNRELLEFGQDIIAQAADADLKVGYDTAMSLKGGKLVVANIVIPEAFSILGSDAHDLNLGVYTSHDGSKALGADISAVRRVCWNTHQMAMASAKSSIKIRHTRTMHDRMSVAARTLGLALDYSKAYAGIMEQFAAEDFTLPMVDLFLESLFPVEAPKPGEKVSRKVANAEALREGVKANILHTETIPEDLRFTKFGVFNGTTEFVDHIREIRTDKRVERAEQLVLSQMPGGTGYALKERAFTLLSA